jgi:hypothetical protein
LDGIPFVDGHAHPPLLERPASVTTWWAHWFEGNAEHAGRAATLSANRWALVQLGEWLDCPPVAEDVVEITNRTGQRALLAMLGRLGVEGLVLDTGHPPPELTWDAAAVADASSMHVAALLRVETLAERLAADRLSFDDLVDRFDATLSSARRDGYVGLKSIIAYRSGLAVGSPTRGEARAAHAAHVRAGCGRLIAKDLLDFLFARTLRAARDGQLPLQVHTGTGDRDLDPVLGNPALLHGVLESGRADDVSIVLLHGAFPYTAEAALLASVHPNVHVDVSACIPPHGRQVLVGMWRVVLAVAPLDRIEASSDATGLPEQIAVAAMRARDTLGEAIEELVRNRAMSPADAERTAADVLGATARQLYR